jgi:hypothetical protein
VYWLAATDPPIVEAFQVIVAVVEDALAAGLAGALRVVTLPVAWPDPVAVKYASAPLTKANATRTLVVHRRRLGVNRPITSPKIRLGPEPA